MKELIEKITKDHYFTYSGFKPEKLGESIRKVIDSLSKDELRSYLTEARDNDYASYSVKKDKVIASVSAQKASAFTALAKSWQEVDKGLAELEVKKRELNELKNTVAAQEDALHNKIKEKVLSIFDDSESALTLSVECLNSSFTLSKLTEANQDKVVTPAGEIISTDYKKVVDLLLEQNQDLKATIDALIKQASVIASADVVKKGAQRRLSVDIGESVQLNEGIFDRIINAVNKFANKIKSYFNRIRTRQGNINYLIDNLI